MRNESPRGGTHVPMVQHHAMQTRGQAAWRGVMMNELTSARGAGWRLMVGEGPSVGLWALSESFPFKSVHVSSSRCHHFPLSPGSIFLFLLHDSANPTSANQINHFTLLGKALQWLLSRVDPHTLCLAP